MATELIQTKSRFALVGKIKGISRDKAYKFGTSEKNGRDWRRIQFGVQTDETNVVYVELMGSEKDVVYAYNSSTKKTIKVDWDDRFDDLPKGFRILEAGVSEAVGKKSRGMSSFDAVDEIHDNFEDGDSVKISGNIEYGTYTNQETEETVVQRKFVIQNIEKIADVDFEAKDFKPTSEFMQELVVIGHDYDKELDKLFINGYTIQYGGKFLASTFVVDGSDNKKFLTNIKKALKPGDFLKATGVILNAVEFEEAEEEETDEDIFGGTTSTTFNKKPVVKSVTKELRITGVPEYEPKKYNIDNDFVVDEAEANFEGKTKPKKESPFGGKNKGRKVVEEEEDEDDDDSDVPF